MANHERAASHRDAPFDLDDPTPDPLDDWRPPLGASLRDRWGQVQGPGHGSVARPIALMAVVLVAIVIGWWFLRPPAPPIEAAIPQATDAVGAADAGGSGPTGSADEVGGGTSTTVAPEVVVQAAGAVARPGVYRLGAGSRVDDLVRDAGGLGADADPDRINLASPLTDGQRVFVPRIGEEPPEVVAGEATTPPPAGTDQTPDGPPTVVNLNTATAEELDTLPGVGPSTATAILSYREEHGSFASVDELLEVRGIGEAKLEAVRDLVAV